MEKAQDITTFSSIILYFVIDTDTNIIFENRVFTRAFQHVRPTNIFHLTTDKDNIIDTLSKLKSDSNTPVKMLLSTKDGQGGYMHTVFECYKKDAYYFFAGFQVIDAVEIDEMDLSILKNAVKQMSHITNHGLMAQYSNLKGLIGLMKDKEGIEFQMMEDAILKLGEDIINLASIISENND